jgi:hypothetical protein
MASDVFELLERKNLNVSRDFKFEILKLSENDMHDLSEEISESLRKTDLAHIGPVESKVFNFTASPYTVGFMGCTNTACKVSQAREFVSYSILYADSVALPNVFPIYSQLPNLSSSQFEEYRLHFASDILVLWELEPIIRAGLAAFVPKDIATCKECGDKLESSWNSIENKMIKAFANLESEISSKSRLIMTPTENGIVKQLILPQELYNQVLISIDPEESPKWLANTRKYKRAINSGEPFELTAKQIEKSGIIKFVLYDFLDWARVYMFSRVFMQSKFLTSRPVDGLLFDALIDNPELRWTSRNIQESLPLKIPTFKGVDAKILLRIREDDFDSFLNFRSKIVEIENEYRKKNGIITKSDAEELYEDVVYPSLIHLETKTKAIQGELRKKVARNISIAIALVFAGISTGLIPNDLSLVLKAIGGCELVKTASDLWKSTEVPEEVRSDPFYFLWNVDKYKNHKH